MSRARRAARAIVLILLAGCNAPPGSAGGATGAAAQGEPSAEEFLTAYRNAHEARDVEAAMRLVHLDGVSEQLQEGLRRGFRTNFERGLAGAELVDPAEPPLQEKTIEGRTYRANVAIVKELKVEFTRLNTPDGEISGRTYPVGVVNGRYVIASTVVSDNR